MQVTSQSWICDIVFLFTAKLVTRCEVRNGIARCEEREQIWRQVLRHDCLLLRPAQSEQVRQANLSLMNWFSSTFLEHDHNNIQSNKLIVEEDSFSSSLKFFHFFSIQWKFFFASVDRVEKSPFDAIFLLSRACVLHCWPARHHRFQLQKCMLASIDDASMVVHGCTTDSTHSNTTAFEKEKLVLSDYFSTLQRNEWLLWRQIHLVSEVLLTV